MGKEILESLKGKGEKVSERFITTVRSLVAGITFPQKLLLIAVAKEVKAKGITS